MVVGPPPEARGRHGGALIAMVEALEAHPGEWIEFAPVANKTAQGQATNLRRKGYEVTTRGDGKARLTVVYARKTARGLTRTATGL